VVIIDKSVSSSIFYPMWVLDRWGRRLRKEIAVVKLKVGGERGVTVSCGCIRFHG